jgi:hypothetical protein
MHIRIRLYLEHRCLPQALQTLYHFHPIYESGPRHSYIPYQSSMIHPHMENSYPILPLPFHFLTEEESRPKWRAKDHNLNQTNASCAIQQQYPPCRPTEDHQKKEKKRKVTSAPLPVCAPHPIIRTRQLEYASSPVTCFHLTQCLTALR